MECMYVCLYSNWVTDCLCCWMTSFYSIHTQWEWRTFVPERFIITACGRVLNKPLVAQLVKKLDILWNMKCPAMFTRACRLFISWARRIKSVSTHLCVGRAQGMHFFRSSSCDSFGPCVLHASFIVTFFDQRNIWRARQVVKHRKVNFVQPPVTSYCFRCLSFRT